MITDDSNKTGEHNTFLTSYFAAINAMNRNLILKTNSSMCLTFPLLLPSISKSLFMLILHALDLSHSKQSKTKQEK